MSKAVVESVYVAGPMRGYPEFNFPAFDAERDRLLALGYGVISPADVDRELGIVEHLPREEAFAIYMKRDIEILLYKVQAISFLPHWEDSEGANVEWTVGKALNHTLWFPGDEIPPCSLPQLAGATA